MDLKCDGSHRECKPYGEGSNCRYYDELIDENANYYQDIKVRELRRAMDHGDDDVESSSFGYYCSFCGGGPWWNMNKCCCEGF